jgi:hypothetical protein
VHVVELLCVWFLFTIVTLWIPAIFDSFSLDYLASLLGAVCFVIWSYDLAPLDAVVRMWLAWFAGAIAVAMFINFASNLLRSRQFSLGIVFVIGSYVLYRQEQKLQFTSNIAHAIGAMDTEALGGFDFLSASFSGGSSTTNGGGSELSFVSNLLMAVAVTVLFALLNEVSGWKRSSKSRASIAARRRRKLPLVTFAVLAVKLSQVLIFGSFLLITILVTTLLKEIVLPVFLSAFPRQMNGVVAPVLGCLVFGALMDSREDCLVHMLRALGLLDPAPPVEGDAAAEGEQE